jgi:hypothetical protein
MDLSKGKLPREIFFGLAPAPSQVVGGLHTLRFSAFVNSRLLDNTTATQ